MQDLPPKLMGKRVGIDANLCVFLLVFLVFLATTARVQFVCERPDSKRDIIVFALVPCSLRGLIVNALYRLYTSRTQQM